MSATTAPTSYTPEQLVAIEAALAQVANACERLAGRIEPLDGSEHCIAGLRRSARTADETRSFVQERRDEPEGSAS